MVERDSIPIGVTAFTGEGDQLGTVTEVEAEGLVLEDSSGTQHFVPLSAVEAVSGEKLVLRRGFMP